MISALVAAKYLSYCYKETYDECISEMKLHKLLYFAQRESLIINDRPLFLDVFEGWRFGPVIPSIRYAFKEICYSHKVTLDSFSEDVLQITLQRYGGKGSWSLSRLSHGEYSWKKARKGISEYQNGNNEILIEDIRVDACRVKERREMLSRIKI